MAADHPAEDGGRRRFGNMILSRLPVRQVYRHLLPSPVDPGVNGMPRIAVEAVVAAPFGDVRVVTTHLEWYSDRQRTAQVEALRAHLRRGPRPRATWLDRRRRAAGRSTRTCARRRRSSAATSTSSTTIALHARMLAPFADGTPPLANAWDLVHPGVPYPATFKVHEKWVPGDPELHCDFFFVSAELVPRVRGVRSDRETQASDHQPVILELA